MATKPIDTPETKSSGDWKQDQRRGYVAHFDPAALAFDGPEDAFVWLGLPYEGNPMRNTMTDPVNGKTINVLPYRDDTKISQDLNGIPVEWIAWDEPTGCNVYRRKA